MPTGGQEDLQANELTCKHNSIADGGVVCVFSNIFVCMCACVSKNALAYAK